MYIPEIVLRGPVQLGPPSRVFREYWPNWRIRYAKSEADSVVAHGMRHFAREYGQTPDRMPSISAGSAAASGHDYPALLNASAAEIAARCILSSPKPLRALEFGTGSGNTVRALHAAVVKHGGTEAWPLADLTIVEPSRSLLAATSDDLARRGIRHRALPRFAHEIGNDVPSMSVDLVLEVASNHYADPSVSFRAVRNVMAAGGLFVLSEWCYSVTEYPVRFRQILEGLDWLEKAEDMRRFDEIFGTEGNRIDASPRRQLANEQFVSFYINHVRSGIPYKTHALKGHAPVDALVRYLRASGFTLVADGEDVLGGVYHGSNPMRLLGDSDLLMTVVAKAV